MSPVAGMRPTTAHFSPPFLCGGCARHFSPCTHHPAPVVDPTRGCVRCLMVGDWHAVLNVFAPRLSEIYHPFCGPHPQTFGPRSPRLRFCLFSSPVFLQQADRFALLCRQSVSPMYFIIAFYSKQNDEKIRRTLFCREQI